MPQFMVMILENEAEEGNRAPSETKALVSFLMTLRGNDLQPAINASRELTRNRQVETDKAHDAAWGPKGTPIPGQKQ